MAMQNSANGQCVSEITGDKVASRPTRSPMFQHRKARGMKIAGVMVLTEVMFAVKTGKIIVTAKQMKTAVARKGMRMKSVPSGMDVRVVEDQRRASGPEFWGPANLWSANLWSTGVTTD
jgi:hypothetical protein